MDLSNQNPTLNTTVLLFMVGVLMALTSDISYRNGLNHAHESYMKNPDRFAMDALWHDDELRRNRGK